MSGSGGGGGGGGGGDGEPGTDCASLSFQTVLNSPNPQVLPSCKPGDVLALRQPNPAGGPVEAVDAATGLVAGTVTGGRLASLLACMARGEQYIARVISVSNGRCQVEVRHV